MSITVPKGVTTVGEAQGYLQFSHGAKTYSLPYVAHFNVIEAGVKYIETKYGNETNPFHYPLKADGTLDTLNVAMEFHNPMNFALIEIFDGLNPDGGFIRMGTLEVSLEITTTSMPIPDILWLGPEITWITKQKKQRKYRMVCTPLISQL